MKLYKLLPYLLGVFLPSCTCTCIMTHTEGTASDVVDDTSNPTATVNPNIQVSIPTP